MYRPPSGTERARIPRLLCRPGISSKERRYLPAKRAGVSDTSELLRNVHESWHKFLLALSGMPDDFMVVEKSIGLWSVKDIMGHITSWEEIYIEAAREYLGGKVPAVFDLDWEAEGDDLNATLAAERADISLPLTWRNLCQTHRLLVRALSTPEVVAEPDMAALAGEITWKHYEHHAAKVRGYRAHDYPDEGLVYYVLKADGLPDVDNPDHWHDLESSQEYIQCALEPGAVEYMANRLYRAYDATLALLVIDLARFVPEAVRASERTKLSGHVHGWFNLGAVIDVRQMLQDQQGRWHFPWF